MTYDYKLNTALYKYTEEELKVLVEYNKRARKLRLIYGIETLLDELSGLCSSATFDVFYNNFNLLKDSF